MRPHPPLGYPDKLPHLNRRCPSRYLTGCTICLQIVPHSSPGCRVVLLRRRIAQHPPLLLAELVSLGVGWFGLVVHVDHELAGGNELALACRAIAKSLGTMIAHAGHTPLEMLDGSSPR